MNEAPLTRDALMHIAHNMREWDRREIFATRWTDDPDDLVRDALMAGAFSWILGEERPICAIGGIPMWSGVWSLWAFATDEWPRISTSVTKFSKRVIFPKLVAVGAHRLECRAMKGHPSRHWLEWLGAGHRFTQAKLDGFGKRGEDFWLYALDLRK